MRRRQKFRVQVDFIFSLFKKRTGIATHIGVPTKHIIYSNEEITYKCI